MHFFSSDWEPKIPWCHECTDRLPAIQPCTVASTTGYSVPTGYQLHSLHWTACFILAGYRAFLPITNQHQESPTQRSSTSWPLLISSLFTGLRLMTGLIMCSPWQEVFSYTETASTGYRAHQPVTGYIVFTEQFYFTPASYRDYRPAIRCNYCLAPFQYWLQRTGTDQQTHLGIT